MKPESKNTFAIFIGNERVGKIWPTWEQACAECYSLGLMVGVRGAKILADGYKIVESES